MLMPFLSSVVLNSSYFVLAAAIIIPLILQFVYRSVRKKFPISVNCWFCDKNTRIKYYERNNFTCQSCQQYNGFTRDGGYNKIIPEQHDELLNHILLSPRKLDKKLTSNGLCLLCNNNQRLKVYQLAHFEPLNESNYDIEIEHFQKQLEKAYKLCIACDRIVKETISKHNSIILGKKVELLQRSGTTLLNKSTTAKLKQKKYLRYLMCSTVLTAIFTTVLHIFECEPIDIYSYGKNLMNDYKRDLSILLLSSIILMFVAYLKKNYFTPHHVFIKTEKADKDLSSAHQACRSSFGTVMQEELNFSTFKSPLNSTTRWDDEASTFSELAQTDVTKSTLDSNAMAQRISDEIRRNSQSPFSKPILQCQSHSKDTNLSLTLEQLCLAGKANTGAVNKIISPSKFRNPWTGKTWDTDVLSRSSSQSSGIYSRCNSLCGDDVVSLFSEPRSDGNSLRTSNNGDYVPTASALYCRSQLYHSFDNLNSSFH